VAISGSTVVAGAPGKNLNTGAAYVFVDSGTGWSQQGKLTAPNAHMNDQLGFTVGLSGSTAVAGAPGRASFRGAAYVFVRSGSTWYRQAKLLAADGVSNDSFGFSVAVNHSTALIGARGPNSETGAAYVFTRSSGVWSQQAELTAPDGAPGDQFGWSVALGGGGSVAVVGEESTGFGAAYVFVDSTNGWTAKAKLRASDEISNDRFGGSVAIAGSLAVVGATGQDSAAGAAYVFDL